MRRRVTGISAALALCLAAMSGCGGSDDTSEVQPGGAAGSTGGAGSAGAPGGAGGAGASGASGAAGGSGAPSGGKAVADLRADVNRDGKVDVDGMTDDEGEETWDKTRGAIFLANIDDDMGACPKDSSLSDDALAACNDAVDDVINGDDDLLDLARVKVKPWADAPAEAVGVISLNDPAQGKVRLFKNDGSGAFTVFDPTMAQLSADDLKAGVELAVEGVDILRDDSWDGMLDLTLTVKGSDAAPLTEAKDTVRLRLAPVLTRHHLDPAEQIFVAKLSGSDSVAMRTDLKAAIAAAGVPGGLDELSQSSVSYDQWTQDYFETAYMSMPTESGQHIVNVYYRSANVFLEGPGKPLRAAGRVVFTHLRGKDAAGVQQYDIKHDQSMDSLNSFGNTETIPPYTLGDKSYPLGRLLRGSVSDFHPDPTFAKMLEAQKVQPHVYIDTSWLLVGHVDETLSFLKAPTPRGWVLVVNDAALAKQMFEDQQMKGNGAVKVFAGKMWEDDQGKEYSAETTIDGVLKDADVLKTSQEAVTRVADQLDTLKQETGLTDDEIIHIPYMHMSIDGLSIAYQPGTVNGIYLSDTVFGAPDPHGPVIDGKDIFKAQMEDAFGKVGVTVKWIEDWDLYHRLSGEVHCGTNTRRKVPDSEKWWESGY